jgi:hypothetical protein
MNKIFKIFGISCGGCLLSLVLLVALGITVRLLSWGPYDLRSQTELDNGYKAEFSVSPPSGVQVLKARQVIIADSGGQFLEMKMTPEEIDRHIRMGFVQVSEVPTVFSAEEMETDANRPSWWTMPLPSDIEYYENKSWSKSGGWSVSKAYMAVDRRTGTVWLSCEKQD